MKPSYRLDYAIRAMVDLALHEGTGPVKVSAIAKRQKIPARYLEQLFNRLRREGLVKAERGPRGGYRLKRPAQEILLADIFRTLESAPESSNGNRISGAMRGIWKQVEQAVETTLEATALSVLVEKARKELPSVSHRYTFHI